MWGLFVIIIFLIGAFVHSCKNGIEDNRSKQNAKNANQKYYLDWHGKQRRIDNNHRILEHVTDYRTGDKVDLDMKTNEILRNYSQEERLKRQQEELSWAEDNKKEKEKAIKEGRYAYSSKEKRKDPTIGILPWEYFQRRVSDNLLLEVDKNVIDYSVPRNDIRHNRSVYVDAKYKFRLYECGIDARKNLKYLEADDKYNRWRCDYLANEGNSGMTKDELFQYAKNIGAIFVKGGRC